MAGIPSHLIEAWYTAYYILTDPGHGALVEDEALEDGFAQVLGLLLGGVADGVTGQERSRQLQVGSRSRRRQRRFKGGQRDRDGSRKEKKEKKNTFFDPLI